MINTEDDSVVQTKAEDFLFSFGRFNNYKLIHIFFLLKHRPVSVLINILIILDH